jgi:hypothetical protein
MLRREFFKVGGAAAASLVIPGSIKASQISGGECIRVKGPIPWSFIKVPTWTDYVRCWLENDDYVDFVMCRYIMSDDKQSSMDWVAKKTIEHEQSHIEGAIRDNKEDPEKYYKYVFVAENKITHYGNYQESLVKFGIGGVGYSDICGWTAHKGNLPRYKPQLPIMEMRNNDGPTKLPRS